MSTKEDILSFANEDSMSSLPSLVGLGPTTRNNKPYKYKEKRPAHRKEDNEMIIKRRNTTRKRLESVVELILARQNLPCSYAAVYQDVELLSLCKYSEQALLADHIMEQIELHFRGNVLQTLRSVFDCVDPIEFAQTFLLQLGEWLQLLRLLRNLFLHLDRNYLHLHPKRKTIVDFGLYLVTRDLFTDEATSLLPKLCHFHASLHLRLIQNNSDDLSSLYQSFVQKLESLDFDHIVSNAIQYQDVYRKNFRSLSSDLAETPSTYIVTVLDRLVMQIDLMKRLKMHQIFYKVKKGIIFDSLLHDLASCVLPSIDNLYNNPKHLLTFIRIVNSADKELNGGYMKQYRYLLENHIKDLASSIINQSKQDNDNLVEPLLQYWQSLVDTEDDSFTEEISMASIYNSGVTKALGSKTTGNYALIKLSKFCDGFVRNKDTAFESGLKQALAFFRLLPNKNDFLALYERDLSKRLLLAKAPASIKAERRIIKNFLVEIGDDGESNHLHAMLQGVADSREAYLHLQLQSATNIDFNAIVLKKSDWPEIPRLNSEGFQLPPALNEILGEFTALYQLQSLKRELHKLDWSNLALHQVTLQTQFDQGPKDLLLNCLQASVLLQLNDTPEKSFQEIQQSLNVDDKLLKRVVKSLSSDKYPILKIAENRVIFNLGFSDKSSKIRVPMARDKEGFTVEESIRDIQRNRDNEIRAAVTRTLKLEKEVLYPELLGNMLKLLEPRGEVLIDQLKRNIEYLITAEYISRDSDGQTLRYIA